MNRKTLMGTILYDEEFLPVLIELIKKARKKIYIITFKAEVTTKRRGRHLKQLFDILVEKAANGVDVRLLTNRRDNRGHIPDSNAYAMRFLGPTKVKVRYLPNDRIVHAKLIVVDGQKAILGSHNLSVKSCHNNLEVSTFISEATTTMYLEYHFDNIWLTAKEC